MPMKKYFHVKVLSGLAAACILLGSDASGRSAAWREVTREVKHDVSLPLREMAKNAPAAGRRTSGNARASFA